MKLLRILDEAVVLTPLVQNRSLIPRGIPSRGREFELSYLFCDSSIKDLF